MTHPPTSPLADPSPDPRVPTPTERTRLDHLRLVHTWYDDRRAADDVRWLLNLVDRVTAPTTEEVDRGATTVPEDLLPVPGGGAPRAAPAAAAPPREPGETLRPAPTAGVAPDEAAALAGRLDGLRAALDVLLEDVTHAHPTGPVARTVVDVTPFLGNLLDTLVDVLTWEVS